MSSYNTFKKRPNHETLSEHNSIIGVGLNVYTSTCTMYPENDSLCMQKRLKCLYLFSLETGNEGYLLYKLDTQLYHCL